MDGIGAVSNSGHLQMAAAVKKRRGEGSSVEEATESQAEKLREQQKAEGAPSMEAVEPPVEAAREQRQPAMQNMPPPAASTDGSGTIVNLLA